MNTKKCLIAWVVGFLAMFILSGIWYMLLMEDVYKTGCYIPARETPLMAYIALGYVVLALLMAYLWGDEKGAFWEIFSQKNNLPFHFSISHIICIFYNILIPRQSGSKIESVLLSA